MSKQTKLTNWGNSKATRLPIDIIRELNIQDEQKLEVTIKDNSIVLTPIKNKPTNIHELFEDWEDDGIREKELNWGESKGQELEW